MPLAYHTSTEKFYDFSGSVGFITTAFVSLYTPYLRDRFWLGKNVAFPGLATHAPRQLLLTGALVLWAGRLGSFLITRVFKDGKDSRFDKIKTDPLRFFGAWVAQGELFEIISEFIYMKDILSDLDIARWASCLCGALTISPFQA